MINASDDQSSIAKHLWRQLYPSEKVEGENYDNDDEDDM